MIQLDRITQDAGVMGGKGCIRGMRVTVGMIVGQIGAGHTIEEILADYPYLERRCSVSFRQACATQVQRTPWRRTISRTTACTSREGNPCHLRRHSRTYG